MTNPNNCDFLDIVFKTLRLLAYKFVCHNGDDIRAAGTWELNAVGESMDETIQRIRKNLSRMEKNLQLLEQKTGCIEAAPFICTTSSVVIPQYKRRFTGFVGRPLTLARNPESDSDLHRNLLRCGCGARINNTTQDFIIRRRDTAKLASMQV